MKKSLFTLFLFAVMFFCLEAEVLLDPCSLKLNPGDYPDGRFSADILIINHDDRPLSLSCMVGEEDWRLSPGEMTLKPAEEAVLTLEGSLPGDVPVPILFLSEREDVPYLYNVSLLSNVPDVQEDMIEKTGSVFVFFHTPGCRICEEFYNELVPGLIAEGRIDSKPEKLNIYDPGNYERMNDLLADREDPGDQFPLLVMGDRVFRGEKSLFHDFPSSLGDSDRTRTGQRGELSGESVRVNLNWIPVFLAGLLDGINPCAFTTLIFLISYLRLLGRKGREVLKIGLSFTLAVFISYFLIGLGFFQALRLAESFSLVSRIIRLGMIGLLFCLGGMSLHDFLRVRQGRESDAVLQLSRGMKQRIHKTIRQKSRSSWLIPGSFAAGVLISLYELGCTGQIYLPMIVYMIKQKFSLSAVGLLTVYNAGFILPLLFVFLLFYRGMDSNAIGQVFRRRLPYIKLASALLFFGIAIFLILTI